ncbi:MAG: class I SAM-dependent methyltransferase [Anaerolineaceae bacterium]|nr:class I SAM-dependent methyltransferase [Anaerolineaceae bacterium]
MCADNALTFEGISFLQSQRAKDVLDWLSVEALHDTNHLRLVMHLRKDFLTEETGWLLDQTLLRQKAVNKFSSPGKCLYLNEPLQQASSLPLSKYHAKQFKEFRRVADLGCGIGADSLALADVVPRVIAVELDPIRAALAENNARACGKGKSIQVIEGDWTAMAFKIEAAFIDPARRIDGKRVFSLYDMQPPLEAVLELQRSIPNVLVKAAPGVSHEEVPKNAEIEFVSLKGEMKEALLRFGALKQGFKRCATLLPLGEQLTSIEDTEPEVMVGEVKKFLYEPDPAILRAKMVRHLAVQLGATMLDAEIAYLTADEQIKTPFARCWQVLRDGGFHLKTLNHWLRKLDAGEVVIKKRGSPIDPDTFHKRLKTNPKGQKVTVFFTFKRGKPWMIVGQE